MTGGIQTATVTLDRAVLLALSPTSPRAVLSAPGAGRLIVPIGGQYVLTAGTHVYDLFNGGDIQIRYVGSTGFITVTAAGFLNVLANRNVAGFYLGTTFTPSPFSFTQSLFDPVSTFANTGLEAFIGAGHTLNVGTIAAASVAAGGSGWVVNDFFTVTNYGNADAIGQVTSIGGGGAVTGFIITNPGTEYGTDSNPVGCTANGPSVGVGLSINITAITPTQLGDGTVVLTLYYMTVPVS